MKGHCRIEKNSFPVTDETIFLNIYNGTDSSMCTGSSRKGASAFAQLVYT